MVTSLDLWISGYLETLFEGVPRARVRARTRARGRARARHTRICVIKPFKYRPNSGLFPVNTFAMGSTLKWGHKRRGLRGQVGTHFLDKHPRLW